MARVWVTIPTYCEAGNIERILRAVCQQLEGVIPDDFRVLVVDDNSPDGTAEKVRGLTAELPALELLVREGAQGLGAAYRAGFEHALGRGAEIVVVMDADFSHDPVHLPAMLQGLEDADLVLGSRYVAGGGIVSWPRLRRLLSRAGSLYARAILGLQVRDLTGGFRVIRREVLEKVELRTLRAQGYVFNIELTYRALRAGFRVREVPIIFQDRTIGESKISLPIAIEALWLVPSLRLDWLGSRLARARPAAGGAEPRGSVWPVAGSVAEQPRQRSQPGNQQNLDGEVAKEVGNPG